MITIKALTTTDQTNLEVKALYNNKIVISLLLNNNYSASHLVNIPICIRFSIQSIHYIVAIFF